MVARLEPPGHFLPRSGTRSPGPRSPSRIQPIEFIILWTGPGLAWQTRVLRSALPVALLLLLASHAAATEHSVRVKAGPGHVRRPGRWARPPGRSPAGRAPTATALPLP